MIFDTHLLISNILYKSILNQVDFKLNRIDFAYGNIKPDFNNIDVKQGHTLKESLYSLNKYSEELMDQNISIKEFSRSLGIICHFCCDYFCLYHRDGNERKNVFEHLFYELILHIKLITLLLNGKIKLNKGEMFENSVEAIVLKIQKKYNSESKGLTKDITSALAAAAQISELMVCSSRLYFEQNETNILGKLRHN